MNPLPPPLEDGLPSDGDRVPALWVHGLLRGLADSPEARGARLQELARRLQREEPRGGRWRLSRRSLIGVGVAAAVLIAAAVLFGLHSGPAQASAEALVRQAREAHRLPVDRCYAVQWEAQLGLELLTRPRDTQLWTRGDRFWMAAEGRRQAYGQDERGGFWVARSAKVGIRFEADEADLPPTLLLTCALCTMRLETLLDDVLRDFELQWDKNAGAQVIRAELKPDRQHPTVRAAQLEIDGVTHEVRRLVLWRHQATVTYTLIETGSLSDDQYKLEGHLEPGARIYTRSLNPELRRQKLRGG